MREPGYAIRSTARVSQSSQMAANTRASSAETSAMARALTLGRQVMSTRVASEMVRWMDRENSSTQADIHSMDSSKETCIRR